MLKKICIPLMALGVIINSVSFAAASSTRLAQKKVTSFAGATNDFLHAVKSTPDGGYVSVGEVVTGANSIISGNGGKDAVVVKYSSDNTKEWVVSFGGSGKDVFYDVAVLSNGDIIAVGESDSPDIGFVSEGYSDGVIVKFDKNGTQKWVKSIGGESYDYIYSIDALSDDNFVIAGKLDPESKYSGNSTIAKFDSDGNKQWIYTRGYSAYYYNDVIATTDNHIVAVGVASKKTLITKFDSSGAVIWEKELSEWFDNHVFNSVIETSDGGFIASGYHRDNYWNNSPMIVKYSSTGACEWYKRVMDYRVGEFHSSILLDENTFVAIGATYDSNVASRDVNYDGLMVAFDMNGDELWKNTYSGGREEIFKGIDKLVNGEYVVAGYGESNPELSNTHTYDGFIVRYGKPSKPIAPSIKQLDDGKIELTDNNPIFERKDVEYRFNNGSWVVYTGPFSIEYSVDGNYTLEVRSINIYDIESDIIPFIASSKENISDIDVLLKLPNTLAVSLNNSIVDFGEVTGLESVENLDATRVLIDSSLPYDIDIKALDDIAGIDMNNTLDVGYLSIKLDSSAYSQLRKDYTNILKSSPKGINLSHSLSFKLDSTIGHKTDMYSVPIRILVSQS